MWEPPLGGLGMRPDLESKAPGPVCETHSPSLGRGSIPLLSNRFSLSFPLTALQGGQGINEIRNRKHVVLIH